MESYTFPAGRQQQILALLRQKGVVQINELADLCNVSKATIRRDLDDLVAAGSIRRTHGGAVLNTKTTYEPTHREKQTIMVEEKSRIAAAAALLVEDGNSLFLDSGTTTFMVAQRLAIAKNLTIVTNNTEIIEGVEFDPSTTVIVTGGIKRQNYSVIVGAIAESFIRDLNVDITFLGTDAIDAASGVYNVAIEELGVKRAAAACGARAVIVTDSSKFETPGIVKAYGFDGVDTLITDSGISQKAMDELSKTDMELIIV